MSTIGGPGRMTVTDGSKLNNRDDSRSLADSMTVFETLESSVRYYCRQWPACFTTASGSLMTDEQGKTYIDFFSGAGALSYGHNNPLFIEVAVDHLRSGRLLHSLDTYTPEKRAFLSALDDYVLAPRELEMRVQFVGPTGATAVEAAILLAERLTGRPSVIAYEGGFHGMTARAASVSAALRNRNHGGCVFLPYVDRHDEAAQAQLELALQTTVHGHLPGALIIEPVQGDGGGRPFDPVYLSEVRRCCDEHGVIVIADEVQAGVGRTGPFFSYEPSGLDPDIICLSKSLSGLGLPLAVNLVRQHLDRWEPGEFTGTFRGNNLAFATGAALLRSYWSNGSLEELTTRRGQLIGETLEDLGHEPGVSFLLHGRGMLWGLEFPDPRIAAAVVSAAFEMGLIVEVCGPDDNTVKVLPSLLIPDDQLETGLDQLAAAVRLQSRSGSTTQVLSPSGTS
jgi:diaminobutyrate-2-oxoglutarate transaminase